MVAPSLQIIILRESVVGATANIKNKFPGLEGIFGGLQEKVEA